MCKTPGTLYTAPPYNANVAWFADWAKGNKKAWERWDNEIRPCLLSQIKSWAKLNQAFGVGDARLDSEGRADQCKNLYDDFCGWIFVQRLQDKYRGLSGLKGYLGGRTLTSFLNSEFKEGQKMRNAGERWQEKPDNRVFRREGFNDAETGELEIGASNTRQDTDKADARLDRAAPLDLRPRGDAPLDNDRSLDEEIYRVLGGILQDMSEEERQICVLGCNALMNDVALETYETPGFGAIFNGLTRRLSGAFNRYGDETRERLQKRARNGESRILIVLLSKIDPNTGKWRNNNDNNR
ncbi:MAG: hypothetical protein IJO06_14695 [Thermoguttaceae bacterium]|nr:hypothetical protein [Thermoguttaceae bacterium]